MRTRRRARLSKSGAVMNNYENKGLHDLLRDIAERKDEHALERVIEMVEIPLKAKIRRLSSALDDGQIKGIFSQVMLSVWLCAGDYRGGDRGDPEMSAWAWIHSITRNGTIDVVRKIERRKTKEIQSADLVSLRGMQDFDGESLFELLGSQDPSPLDRITDNEGYKEFIETLDLREAQIIEMRLGKKSQKEIAKILDISEARVSQIMKDLTMRADEFLGFR
jgi:RNA polymerase sigma factor (sigma-70 family)